MTLEVLLSTCFWIVTTILLGNSEQSSFEDNRCVCACPSSKCPNGTGPIFVNRNPPNECRCEIVVPLAHSPNKSGCSPDTCRFCKCQHENRNTTTIKVVVIFIICVVMLLVIYMLFLLCLEPLIQQQRTPYDRQIDDDVNLDNLASMDSRSPGDISHLAAAAAGAGAGVTQRSLLNRVSNEQQKWKGTVQEQRRNIYHYHNMLN
ncbi:hypothetical protein ACOMHN_021626 [Nucella lapillus]